MNPNNYPSLGDQFRFDELCPMDVMRYGTRMAAELLAIERGMATEQTAEHIRHEMNHLILCLSEPESVAPEAIA